MLVYNTTRYTIDEAQRAYHEAVGEDLDAVVAEGGSGELDVADLPAEDLRGRRHDDDEHVHHHGRGRQRSEEPQLQRRRSRHAAGPRQRPGEQRLQTAVDGGVVTRRPTHRIIDLSLAAARLGRGVVVVTPHRSGALSSVASPARSRK
jgi:hypothetical protein